MSDIRSERMVLLIERLLTILIWLNAICAMVFTFLFVGSLLFSDWLAQRAYGQSVTADELAAAHLVFGITLIIVPLAHVALTRLRAIVASVRAGDPFVADNARRLTAIAWSLLGIMICDLAFGILAMRHDAQIGWSFSLTGWLAVLLLFVLARVFDHGTRLRDDVEGTV